MPEAIRRIAQKLGPMCRYWASPQRPGRWPVTWSKGKTKEGFATVKSFLYHEPATFRKLLLKNCAGHDSLSKCADCRGGGGGAIVRYLVRRIEPAPTTRISRCPPCNTSFHGITAQRTGDLLHQGVHHLMPAVARAGANVLSVDWRADLAALRRMLGPGMALQGNVDPAILLGPPEKIREATRDAVAALGGSGAHPESGPRHL